MTTVSVSTVDNLMVLGGGCWNHTKDWLWVQPL